jgi:signal peptidase I
MSTPAPITLPPAHVRSRRRLVLALLFGASGGLGVLFLLLFVLNFKLFNVPSGSMLPTVIVGDTMLVSTGA